MQIIADVSKISKTAQRNLNFILNVLSEPSIHFTWLSTVCSYNLVYNFLMLLLPLKSPVFVVHFSNAFWYVNKAFAEFSSWNEIVPVLVIFHLPYCENMFLLVSLSKSKFFTRVTLTSFVQHSCLTRVVRVALVLPLCCTCVTRVSLVSLVSHSCRSCHTHVARVWLSCCKLDQIVDYVLTQMFFNKMRSFLTKCITCF